MKNKIISKIASFEDEILAFTRALVAVRTENPPGAFYGDCIKVIGNELRKIGLDFTVIEVPHPKKQIATASDEDGGSYPRYCLLSYYGRAGIEAFS